MNIERADNGSIFPNLKITAKNITIKEQAFTFNAPMHGLPVPAREGFDFAGWYKEDEEKLFEEGRMLDVSNNFTLVAHWTEIQQQ